MALVAGPPSVIASLASRKTVNDSFSPGTPLTASGFEPPAGGAGDQVCWIVSGLYWKMMMFGRGIRNVGMNSTNAPFRNFPAIAARLSSPECGQLAERVDHTGTAKR